MQPWVNSTHVYLCVAPCSILVPVRAMTWSASLAIAHTFWHWPSTLTYDLDFQFLASYGRDLCMCKKLRLTVSRFKRNRRTDWRTRPIALPSRPTQCVYFWVVCAGATLSAMGQSHFQALCRCPAYFLAVCATNCFWQQSLWFVSFGTFKCRHYVIGVANWCESSFRQIVRDESHVLH